jgi:sugar-specific transcriptional regulator TrmB
MLQSIEDKSKRELVEIVKMQMEEFQKLDKQLAKVTAERNLAIKGRDELIESQRLTIADAVHSLMKINNVENFTSTPFEVDGKNYEITCRYVEGKTPTDTLIEQKVQIKDLEKQLSEVTAERDAVCLAVFDQRGKPVNAELLNKVRCIVKDVDLLKQAGDL